MVHAGTGHSPDGLKCRDQLWGEMSHLLPQSLPSSFKSTGWDRVRFDVHQTRTTTKSDFRTLSTPYRALQEGADQSRPDSVFVVLMLEPDCTFNPDRISNASITKAAFAEHSIVAMKTQKQNTLYIQVHARDYANPFLTTTLSDKWELQ